MKTFVTLAAFAAGTNALVGRSNSCCFHLTASGGVSGSIGQLDDGQTRVGDNTLSPAQFCLDSSNGTITDSKGRGCCDEGAAPTAGFSIDSQGELEFQGSENFIACETGERNGRNIYTTDSSDVTMCKPVNLHADSCSSSGAGASSSAVVTPVHSTVSVSSVPASSVPASSVSASSVPASSVPVSSVLASSVSASSVSVSSVPVSSVSDSVPVSSLPATESTPAASPSGYPGSGSGAGSGSSVTVTESTPAASPSGYPGSGSGAGSGSSVTVTESTPAASPSGYPGSGSGSGSGSSVTVTESTPAASPSGYPGSGSGSGSGSSVTVTESTLTASPSGYPGSGPGSSVSAPAGSGSPPLAGSPYTVLTTVTVTDCSCSSTPGAPAPGGASSVPGSQPSGPVSSPAPASTPIVSSQPGGPASTPASSFTVYPSVPASGSSVPASSPSVAPSATGSSSGSCPTDLSGDYEFPHLIIPVDSSSPDTAPGTSYNGTVTSSISSLFNFDIPSSDAGKTCSLVFLFPEKQDLETSSYSFSGDGQIDFAQLSSPASSSTSYSNMPSVSQDFGTTTVSPGNSYVISTFSCPAGQTVGYEMKNAGSTDLNFFEDYNPSPLGLYITVC
ncbi:hypothetical protein N7510_007368 [Penicillium lagena]|uniref:uncharacterized protein n=1 Tax=Penicillium lagena TaxID=94218 RepID=UPI002540F3B6|nr:uncharacterized protein N7510_007368 [Penicillium lagena]KAJ5610649.1 hypothetical protein N7510_007368 [Penicillium lagena]